MNLEVAEDGTRTGDDGMIAEEEMAVAKEVGIGTVLEVIVVGTTGKRLPPPMGVNSGIED